MRVVVIGGGVVGCAAAERLSRDRHQVLLLERDRIGGHASGAAAGLLAPYSETDGAGFELGERSLALFPELVDRVERSQVTVEYREQETIRPALTAADERRLRRSRRARGWLDAEQARAAEPELNPRVRGAAIFGEAQVTPSRLVEALARTAACQGADIREGTPVGDLATLGGRLRGVRTADGLVEADAVVLAAGPWSPALASPLGVALDVRPRRGQLVTLRPGAPTLSRALTWHASYLVPKADGSLVAGSTEEEAGFDARPTAEGVASLLQFAVGAVPRLGSASVERVWAALRPATPDGRPIVGPAPQVPGLVIATGHNRTGILLAPITAELVAEAIDELR